MSEPMEKLRLMTVNCCIDPETRMKNMRSCLALGYPVCVPEPRHDRKVAIVASGPSAKDYLKEIAEFDGEVWAINGSHDWLRENGIIPTAACMVDPAPELITYLWKPIKGVTYYMGSICDPAAFAALKGHDVRIWHSQMPESMPASGSYAVPGGSTCVSRAAFLTHMLGFRDVYVYGSDSSFAETTHCFGVNKVDNGVRHKQMQVRVGDQLFSTESALVQQANELAIINDLFPGRITFRCTGLCRALMDSPIRDLQDVLDLYKVEVEGCEAAA